MIILDTVNRKLEVVLGGAVTTNQLEFVASYQDLTTAPPATVDGVTNNTTAVTLVDHPASSVERRLDYLSIYNADTAAATVTVRYNDNGTVRILVSQSLPAGSSLLYNHGPGWSVKP